jgi:hypothetical protein
VQALLFPDIGLKTLGSNSTGASFTWPKIVAGDDLRLKLRLIETLSGEKVLSRRTISALKLSIGKQDARPTSGSFQLKIGSGSESAGVNTTASLNHNLSEGDLAAALNALTDAALSAKKPFAVVKRDDSYHIRAADSGTVTWVVVDNALLPQSLVDIRPYSFDEGTSYELRLTQTVLCEQTAFDAIVPDLASVSVIQVGAEESGIKRNTIQQIFFPPELSDAYSFRLKWGFRRTAAIGSPADAEAIQTALQAIAETDETVTVTDGEDRVLIEFSGDALAGTSVPALVIEHLVTPDADSVVTLVTATDGLAKYMATVANAATGITEFKIPVSLKLWLVGEQDEEETEPLTFINEVTFQKPVSLEAFAAAAVLNPTRPLSNRSYLPFSPTQITETQRGYLLTGGTALGDGTATEFQVDHNLGTRHVYVALFGSAVDGQMLKHGTDYEVEIVSDNAVLIIFTTAPASGGVVGGICTVASTNAFVDLEINIGQVIGLEPRLQALEENVTALQALVPSGSLGASTQISTAPILSVAMPLFAEAYPAISPDLLGGDAEYKTLSEIPLSALPQNGGLLPAVHDIAVETLTVPVPAAADSYKGRVFRNGSPTASVEIDGGFGRRGVIVRPGEFVACDGRSWYPVKRYDKSATTTPKAFTVTTGTDVCASTAHGFSNGAVVMVSSDGTLPAPLLPEVTYYIRDAATDSFKLAATSGGAAIDLTTAGTGVHSVVAAPKSTFYPVDFERELFIIPISSKQFRIKKTLTIQAGIEAALVHLAAASPRGGDWRLRDQRSTAQWSIVLRWGTTTSESSPATTGANLKGIAWNATPILEHRINLVQSPMVHTFGCRIRRTAESTFTTEEILYGLASASQSNVTSADLVLGAWLERFDTNDGVSDPRGLALLMGLNRSNDEGETLGTLTLN